ncbi:MAG: ABC transporter permease [Candidatus Diapherotrites archaeon]
MLKLSFLNLFRRKTRTILSLAAIVVGVAAIIAMVSIVDGFNTQITDTFSQIKGVMVIEKDSMDPALSKIDESYVGELESWPGVYLVVPEIYDAALTIDGKPVDILQLESVTLYGADAEKLKRIKGGGFTAKVERGSMLNASDKASVMIGSKIAEDYKKFVGSTIGINGKKFKVKGIFSSAGFIESTIVFRIEDLRDLVSMPSGKIAAAHVYLDNPDEDEKFASLVEFRLGEKLDAMTSSSASSEFNEILGDFRLVVFLVAGISAIVAGIGIMNTVLMSIMERSKEIGTLKATGWTDDEVVKMVLFESAFIGILGGIAGVAFGSLLSIAISETIIQTTISLQLLLLSFAFAFFVGIIAGIYPSIVASSLDPIEAIRGGR